MSNQRFLEKSKITKNDLDFLDFFGNEIENLENMVLEVCVEISGESLLEADEKHMIEMAIKNLQYGEIAFWDYLIGK